MKILIAPLNWGLGHATRCVPLIDRYRQEGHEVILGGDGDSLLFLKRRYPTLRLLPLAPLDVRYNKGSHQLTAWLRLLPRFIRFIREDRKRLHALQQQYHFDLIISDNRFGLYTPECKSVYITHQLQIRLPRLWRWAEPLATRIHARFYRRFDEVWVPDYADSEHSLSGYLGHPARPMDTVRYIGPLSRFAQLADSHEVLPDSNKAFDVVALLSGPEPQRSRLEEKVIRRYAGREERVLIVRGRMQGPPTRTTHRTITLVPRLEDKELATALCSCQHIIARSGYSTLMDLAALGLLTKASLELIPTPGQSEQEYLAAHYRSTMLSEA